MQVYSIHGRRRFSGFIPLFFSPSPALSTYANGNPATGFSVHDGRVSNGVMATGVSVRCFPALREGGGRSLIAPTGVIDVAPRRGAVVGLDCAAERSMPVPYVGVVALSCYRPL